MAVMNAVTKVAIVSNELEVKNNYFSPSELVAFLDDAKKQESITNYCFLLTVYWLGCENGAC
ncbi:hypothetical protein GGGNBK_11595 [Sporosarcina sp. ANT_H38]